MMITDIKNKLTEQEIMWFSERTNTLPSGLVTFSSHSINKFKKLTGQVDESNTVIRHQMINIFGEYA